VDGGVDFCGRVGWEKKKNGEKVEVFFFFQKTFPRSMRTTLKLSSSVWSVQHKPPLCPRSRQRNHRTPQQQQQLNQQQLNQQQLNQQQQLSQQQLNQSTTQSTTLNNAFVGGTH
jgi:hypothetical protein